MDQQQISRGAVQVKMLRESSWARAKGSVRALFRRSKGGAGVEQPRAKRRFGRGKWHRRAVSGPIAALALVLLGAPAALGFASWSGWTNGYGWQQGTGAGLVLSNFYSIGQNATFRQKWLGAQAAWQVASNAPSGIGELWCIEGGTSVTRSYAYTWSTDTNVRARYLMWLASNTWNNPDGRAAVQYLLYADTYPGLGDNNDGTNFDYESRVYNHAEFTQQAKNYVAAFRNLSTSQMRNQTASLDAVSLGGVPTKGNLDGIGVRDAWGGYVSGLSYTVTITGPAVFDSTGTRTVSGSTASGLINDVHAWTATGAGVIGFSITYANADAGSSVYIGSGGGSQDMVAGAGFRSLSISDPTEDGQFFFQPGGDTQVPASTVSTGDALVDVFTPTAINGTTWAREDSGNFVPATFDWYLYDAGPAIPGMAEATAPSHWQLLEQIQVTATGGPGVPIQSTFTSTVQAGHAYVFVVTFSRAAQPVATQPWFVGDWADAAGLEDEVIYAPSTAVATSVASSETRGDDVVLLDEVTFSGFPVDHGTWMGNTVFGPDVATVQQRLYFFPEGVAGGIADDNTSAAQLICDITVPATNGTHLVDEACAVALKDGWGQLVAGTYAWTSTFSGDARVRPFATSVTDVAEQVTFTNEPLAVTTQVQQAPVTGAAADASLEVWDTATVTGYAPVGSRIEFSLYRFDAMRAPVCDAETLITTLDAVAPLAGPGEYESERYTLTIPATAQGVGFVETVYGPNDEVLHTGVCGAATESFPIVRADSDDTDDDGTRDLAYTGAGESWRLQAGGAAGSVVLGAALVGVALVLRRRIVE